MTKAFHGAAAVFMGLCSIIVTIAFSTDHMPLAIGSSLMALGAAVQVFAYLDKRI